VVEKVGAATHELGAELVAIWIAVSIVWLVFFHTMVLIEKAQDVTWSEIIGHGAYWSFVLVPPLAMGLMFVIIAVVVARVKRGRPN
jgi:hypothetical protein